MKKDFNEFKSFIKDKQVAVVGIGVSNIPLIHFLVELGARVTAFDKKSAEDLGDTVLDFTSKGVELVLGESYLEKLTGFEVIFKTPSMRIDHPVLVKAKTEGAYITSEMEEFIRYCPAKTFGITGSDGKTTTTSLIYHILKEAGYTTWIGGNIGKPLFADIEKITAEDMVVLELSSFQLMTMRNSTDVAVVTNLTPNHLDIHKGMEEYIDAKKNIYKFQSEQNTLVLNQDNEITKNMKKEAKGKVLEFSMKNVVEKGAYFKDNKLFIMGKEVCTREQIKLVGLHNVENLLAAFCAVYEEATTECMLKVASTFMGEPHRIEFIREIDGVRYYNDSIASSPTRTLAGLKAFSKPIILIAGGYDKHIPFEPLAEEGYNKIKAMILLGVTKHKIKAAFDKVLADKGVSFPIILVENLEEAAQKAKQIATKGDIVTLSPACASFDMFPNFEVRGNMFKEVVKKL